jgi:biopolymer transport protein ExbD
MGMNVGSSGGGGDPEPIMDVNTTPLIDVMLVLLVMLIITIPVQTHAVKLDLPVNQNQQAPLEPPPVVSIEVDFDGTIYWDGVIVADRNELRYRFQQAHDLPQQPEFHIRPNRLVAYKYVAGVMATAQKLGITNIGLVGTT